MENTVENTPMVSALPQTKRKGIKTADVKRLKREGHSNAAISQKLNISGATVSYHLGKRRKAKTAEPEVKSLVAAVDITTVEGFEAELFGTIIKLDRVPVSIERIGNRIVIK